MRYKVHHRGPNIIQDILDNALAIAKTGDHIAEVIEAIQPGHIEQEPPVPHMISRPAMASRAHAYAQPFAPGALYRRLQQYGVRV